MPISARRTALRIQQSSRRQVRYVRYGSVCDALCKSTYYANADLCTADSMADPAVFSTVTCATCDAAECRDASCRSTYDTHAALCAACSMADPMAFLATRCEACDVAECCDASCQSKWDANTDLCTVAGMADPATFLMAKCATCDAAEWLRCFLQVDIWCKCRFPNGGQHGRYSGGLDDKVRNVR